MPLLVCVFIVAHQGMALAAATSVAAGELHAVGLKSDGTVVAAGSNLYGQLNVESWTGITQMAASTPHTVGLRSDGTVVAVGYNEYGQLNVDTWAGITQVAAGVWHTVGLRSNGRAVAVGNNDYGQLGVDSWAGITQVEAGWRHTVGLRSDGKVEAAGDNGDGQLNVDDWTGITQIAAGSKYTVGLKSDGTVVAVGFSRHGALNVESWTGITQVDAESETTVGLKSDGAALETGRMDSSNMGSWACIKQSEVAAGSDHIVGLKSDGTVVAVGSNDYGERNVGSWTDITHVAAGITHTVGLKSDGTVAAVGLNAWGQLNVESWTGITQMAAGVYHTVGLKSDGTVVAVGRNSDGSVIGDPVYGEGQLDVGLWTGITQVAAGSYHTVGLESDGTVVAVGRAQEGQLNVGSWTGITQVTAGLYHTVGLKSDGTVVAVGDNGSGQLNVGSWAGITQVAAGSDHTLGLKSDGTVVAVGLSDSGRLYVESWTGITQVAAGGDHTVGLKSDGTVMGSGSAILLGQCGTCSISISPASPQSVPNTGGTGTVTVTATHAGCTWSAVSNDTGWLHITGGTPGPGTGSVDYTVDANTGVSRSGTMTIAGETYTINQAAGDCTITLSPTSPQSVSNAGGTGTVTVTATHAGCTWSAVSNDIGWLHITGGTPGPGTGSVDYTVDANPGVSRTGTMTIAGETYTVNQDSGIPAGNALYLRSATTPNNSVFTDESGAGHVITRYGDTKHVLFGSDTAIRFDGNGDYLKTPASPDWDFGTNDFTVDLWVNFTSTPDNFDGIFSTYKQSGASGGYLMQVVNGTIQWYAPGATGWMNTGVAPVVGEWIHLAAVRSGNVLTIYVNGVDRAHQDCTGRSFNSSNDGLVLGKLYTLTAGYYFGGYMDEVCVTKGFALWTGNFTPPNNPEGMDTDNDGISDAQETGTYLTDLNAVDTDNDGIEDGDELNYWRANWNTDYDGDAGTYANNLLDPDSDNDGLNDGTEVNTHGSDPSTVDTDSDGLDDGQEIKPYGTDPVLADSDGDGMDDGNEVAFWSTHPTAGWDSDSDSYGVINLLDPDSDNDGFTDEKERIAATDPADPASFPVMPAGNALYLRSANPTDPLVFTDESGAGHAITRYGDTKHVTFGTDTAIQLDGNGDYLKTPASNDWNFGTNDFTIDLWVNFTSTPDNFDGIFSTYKKSGTSGGYLMQVTGGTIQWYTPGVWWLNTGVAPVVGQWYHLAAVRSGNVLTIYVNGVDRVHHDCTGLSFNSASDGLVLGKLYTLTAGYYFGGYMDEMRVTKGFALWTGDFTPPNSPE